MIAAFWGDVWIVDEHLVDVHVGHLRRKLGDDPAAWRAAAAMARRRVYRPGFR